MITGLRSKIGQIYRRTQIQLIGSFLLALAVFLIEYSALIIQTIENGSQVPVGETGRTVSGYTINILNDISDLPHADDIITAIFWSVVALMVYFALITLNNTLAAIQEEISVDVQYSKGSAFKVLLTRLGSKFLAAVALVLLCVASVLVLIPIWMDMLSKFVHSDFSLNYVGFFLAGFIGLMLNIYTVWAAAYFTWIYEETG